MIDQPLDEQQQEEGGESPRLAPKVAATVYETRQSLQVPGTITQTGAYLHEVQIPARNYRNLPEAEPIHWLNQGAA